MIIKGFVFKARKGLKETLDWSWFKKNGHSKMIIAKMLKTEDNNPIWCNYNTPSLVRVLITILSIWITVLFTICFDYNITVNIIWFDLIIIWFWKTCFVFLLHYTLIKCLDYYMIYDYITIWFVYDRNIFLNLFYINILQNVVIKMNSDYIKLWLQPVWLH